MHYWGYWGNAQGELNLFYFSPRVPYCLYVHYVKEFHLKFT